VLKFISFKGCSSWSWRCCCYIRLCFGFPRSRCLFCW